MAFSPIYFLDYDKIVDTLIYFSPDITLRFNVQLASKDKNGRRKSYHSETHYPTDKYTNVGDAYSIKRNLNFFFSIDDARDYTAGVPLRINDVVFLKLLIENNIMPWFMGKSRIFGKNPDNGMIVINGKWKPQQLTISDSQYLEFSPIVVEYESEHTSTYGIRMTISRPDNYVDMDLGRFMQFYYFIAYTDMYSVASSMLNYVKTQPYGNNMYNMVEEDSNRRSYNTPAKNFFDDK